MGATTEPLEKVANLRFAFDHVQDELNRRRRSQRDLLVLWVYAFGLFKEWEKLAVYEVYENPPAEILQQHRTAILVLLARADELRRNFKSHSELTTPEDAEGTMELLDACTDELQHSYQAWHCGLTKEKADDILGEVFHK